MLLIFFSSWAHWLTAISAKKGQQGVTVSWYYRPEQVSDFLAGSIDSLRLTDYLLDIPSRKSVILGRRSFQNQ